ncbi:DUF6230 family protein [Luteipulveratus mongoliensis]|uniref:Cholesterol esterase n=1 Tax=Luteipulveratus mongoliensis TaxID=571913 RepID=A0A0K1JDX7_9MICO|nr:DUF6230 family protein [Luteipulveratus mongoliensis]AKU14909.1 hypothetical protein VV02_01910 [Luteipulveratus mongoliensis]
MTAAKQIAYGTRWRRVAVMAVPAIGVTISLAAMTKNDVLASAVVFQGTTASVTAGGLTGERAGIGVVEATRSVDGKLTTSKVVRVNLAELKVDGLCVSQKQSIAGVTYTIKVRAGDGKAGTFETVGSRASLDLTRIKGDGDPGINLDGLVQLGVRSESITTTETNGRPDPNPLDAPSGLGWFGIDAGVGQFRNVRGQVYGLTLDQLAKVPGFKLTLHRGDDPCSGDPIPH